MFGVSDNCAGVRGEDLEWAVVEIRRENLKPGLLAQAFLLGSSCTEPFHLRGSFCSSLCCDLQRVRLEEIPRPQAVNH